MSDLMVGDVRLAYDVFGNAKTALKFSIGKYFTRVMTSYAATLNPMALVTSSLPWNDRDISGRVLPTNRDGIAQDNELDLTRLPSNFGTRNLARLDPDFKREYNVETALNVQHELFRNVSVNAGWYRRSFHNMFLCIRQPGANASDCSFPNTALSPSDYVAVPVVNPVNGEVFNVYNLKSASLLSRVDQLITNSPTDKQIYIAAHGLDTIFGQLNDVALQLQGLTAQDYIIQVNAQGNILGQSVSGVSDRDVKKKVNSG